MVLGGVTEIIKKKYKEKTQIDNKNFLFGLFNVNMPFNPT